MRSSLHLLAPDNFPCTQRVDGASAPLASSDGSVSSDALTSSLQRLQRVCEERRHADWKLESLGCKLAAQLAKMVADADLLGRVLPRHYRARINCGEAYLVKCTSENETETERELFVLARRESTFARLEPRARELTHAQVLEFVRDVEDGLIGEIADFVEHCNLNDERAALCLDHALLACCHLPAPATSRQCSPLAALTHNAPARVLPGRRARRTAISVSQNQKLPLIA